MRENGLDVTIVPEGDGYRAIARDKEGQEFEANGSDLFRVVCELAIAAGIDLENG